MNNNKILSLVNTNVQTEEKKKVERINKLKGDELNILEYEQVL